MSKQLLQSQLEGKPEAISSIIAHVEPIIAYVDAFATNLFNTISLDEIETSIVNMDKHGKNLKALIALDYTAATQPHSLITGTLHLRDRGSNTAVIAFNKCLLQSGVIREFIRKQHLAKQQTSGRHDDHKRDFLRHLVEKK